MVDTLFGIQRSTSTSLCIYLHRHDPASLLLLRQLSILSFSFEFTPLQTTSTKSTASQVHLPSSLPTSYTYNLPALRSITRSGATQSSSMRILDSLSTRIATLLYQRLWVVNPNMRLPASQKAAYKRTAIIIWMVFSFLTLSVIPP
jgi:hypothetical protein